MHQPITNHEPVILGKCLLDGYDGELYPVVTCNDEEFEDLTISSHYLRFQGVMGAEVTSIVDTAIRKMCYGIDLD